MDDRWMVPMAGGPGVPDAALQVTRAVLTALGAAAALLPAAWPLYVAALWTWAPLATSGSYSLIALIALIAAGDRLRARLRGGAPDWDARRRRVRQAALGVVTAGAALLAFGGWMPTARILAAALAVAEAAALLGWSWEPWIFARWMAWAAPRRAGPGAWAHLIRVVEGSGR
jgi:small-conductance mechanosensitive channel